MWTLDAETGKWKMAAPLTYVTRRRRRDVATNTVTVSLEIPYPLPYINLDKPALRRMRCTLIIQVYADVAFTQPLSYMTLQVVTKSPNGGFLGYTTGYTDNRGRACVTIMCGYQHIIVLKPVLGEPRPHRTHHLPRRTVYTNLDHRVMFT